MPVTGASEIWPALLYDNGGAYLHVKHPDYLAKGDLRTVTDGAMTSGSGVLTSATAGFTSADVGKVVGVVGAIALAGSGTVAAAAGVATFSASIAGKIVNGSIIIVAGTSYTVSAIASTTTATLSGAPTFGAAAFTIASPLGTTISGYTNSTTVTLTASATRTVSGATVKYGTDDSAAIAAAIAAAAGLKPVFFGPGSYYATNVSVPTGSVLLGFGSTAQLVSKPLATLDASPILNVTGPNVTIRGLGFDGFKAGQIIDGFSDAYDTGPNSTGRAYRCAIKMKDTGSLWSGLTVDQCSFTGTHGAGIALLNISDVRVTDNVFTLCNFEGVYDYSDFVGASWTTNHHIQRNRIKNGGTGDATTNSSAIVLSSGDNYVIANNVVDTVERAGVKQEYCRRGVVTGNSFANNSVPTFGGIEMQSTTTSVLISSNKIYNWSLGVILNPQVGQTAKNVTIVGNTIDNLTATSTADGISIGNGSIENLHISGNNVRDAKRNCIGIQPNGTVRGLTITGNTGTTTGTTAGRGLHLNVTGGNWRDVLVDGNMFDCGNAALTGAGIYITTSDSSTAAMVRITNNIVDVGTGHNGIRENAVIVTSGLVDDNLIDGALFLSSAGFRCGDGNALIAGSGNTVGAPGLSRTGTTTPITITADDRTVYSTMASAGAVAVNLHQFPQIGQRITIKDGKGDAATNNITINAFSGHSIDTTSTYTIKNNYGAVTLEAISSTAWRVVNRTFGAAAAITTPNAQTAAYVQADVTSLKTAIDAIRTVLTNAGLSA